MKLEDLDKFSDIVKYVSEHNEEELLILPINRLLKYYSLKSGNIINMDEGVKLLNEATADIYTVRLGDIVKEEIRDIKKNIKRYECIYSIFFNDDASRLVLLNLIMYRLTRDETYILNCYCESEEQYFDKSIFHFPQNCVFADCGALDGNTTISFILHCPDYRKVYVYEPIKELYDNCVSKLNQLCVDNIFLRNKAVFDKECMLRFEKKISGSSTVDFNGNIEVQAVSLDEDIKDNIGFIKMDIEGSEKNALLGAQNHIINDMPILAICVYHKPSDLWEIPQIIKEMNSEYVFYLRHYTPSVNETVLYAIPRKTSKKNYEAKTDLSSSTKLLCMQILNNALKTEIIDLRKTNKFSLEQKNNYQKLAWSYEEENKELREWVSQIESGKAYLEEQISIRDNVISELREWVSQVESGKAYLEEQIIIRDNVISESRDWASQLEEGKKYLENQVINRDNVIIELKSWIDQLEGAKNFLENQIEEELKLKNKYKVLTEEQDKKINDLISENKKLAFYLNEEIRKPWYKKIFHKKHK